MEWNLDQNKKNAVAFYQMAFYFIPARAVEIHAADEYTSNLQLAIGGGHFWALGYFVDTLDLYMEMMTKYVRHHEAQENILRKSNV